MKKIWLLLLMTSCVCFFAACSDDDDNGGGNNGENPITDLYLSDEIIVGDTTVLLGKGFATDAQIYVEDAAGERTKIELLEVNKKGITIVLPDIAGGDYALILKQNKGEWKLGTFKVIQMKTMTLIKSLTGKTWQVGGDETPFMDLTYVLAYDTYGKLTSMSMPFETVDENGNKIKNSLAYEFTYADNNILVDGSAIDNENVFPVTYTLQDGKVISSKTKNVDWSTGESVVKDDEYEWSYDGDYLKSLTGTNDIDYIFKDGNLMSIGELQFTYGSDVNNTGVDFVTWSLYLNGGITNDQFMAYLLGVCGKISKNLPTYAMGECEYSYDSETKLVNFATITMDMGDVVYKTSISIEYEKIKVMGE